MLQGLVSISSAPLELASSKGAMLTIEERRSLARRRRGQLFEEAAAVSVGGTSIPASCGTSPSPSCGAFNWRLAAFALLRLVERSPLSFLRACRAAPASTCVHAVVETKPSSNH